MSGITEVTEVRVGYTVALDPYTFHVLPRTTFITTDHVTIIVFETAKIYSSTIVNEKTCSLSERLSQIHERDWLKPLN